MTRPEQETIFRFDAEKREVSIFTGYPSAKLKIERRGYSPWKVSRYEGRAVGWFYKIPYAEFHWRVTGALTAEQREKQLERGRALAKTLPRKNRGSEIGSVLGSQSVESIFQPSPQSRGALVGVV